MSTLLGQSSMVPQPPSRSASSLPPPRSSTPLLIPSAYTHATAHTPTVPALPSKHHHTTKISHKLLHLFDSTKSANFRGTVIIHELANVPQLEGEFSVSWKFRGRRPRGKESAPPTSMRNKPSLPNLKMQPVSTSSPSASSLSLASSSTTSSPATPNYPSGSQTPQARLSSTSLPIKATSLPLTAIHPSAASHTSSASRPHKSSDPPLPEKKTTDPTPLRHSTLPPEVTVASPDLTPQDSLSASPETLFPERARKQETQDSGMPRSKSLLPPAMLNSQPGSAASSTSHLSVPFPRAPARSGTGPSISTIIDPIPGKGDHVLPRPRSLSRTPSMNTLDTKPSSSTSNSTAPSMNRQRSHSGPPRPKTPSLSSSRKGTTPVRPLKAHTCVWDAEIQHEMKIGLGKPIQPHSNGSSTPRLRHPAPVLGSGPLSDSGLRLVIEQLSTSTVNGHPASATDKESLTSMLHNATHGDTKSSSSEKSTNAEKQKTVFGIVDIDLAAFAGKGRTTRRFLLRGSRTNATIKLTVDMRWIGGEELWAAPPMQEGHHVTGMNDLLGGGEAEERVKTDLALAKTPSNASSSSSVISAQAQSNRSGSSSVNMSANISTVSLAAPAPQMAYKTYEHHLRAPSPIPVPERDRDMTPTQSIFKRHTHRHRSHHSRHFRDPPAIQTFKANDLSPDVVIEAIFNPYLSTEESPFTYVQKSLPPGVDHTLETPEGIMSRLRAEEGGGNVVDLSHDKDEQEGTAGHREGGKLGWGLRAKRDKKAKRAVSTPL